jgi:Family of unknown function (DUF5695)
MTRRSRQLLVAAAVLAVAGPLTVHARPGQGTGRGAPPPPTLGLDHGTLDFDTPDFTLKLVKDSQTIAALEPKSARSSQSPLGPASPASNDAHAPFDFTPADELPARQGDGFNSLGDITLRLRQAGWQDGAWVDLASSRARKPVVPASAYQAPASWRLLAAADLTPTIAGARASVDGGRNGGASAGRAGPPASPVTDSPVRVVRSWLVDPDKRLVLHFELKNTSRAPVTVGGLGFPVVFNNMIQDFTTNRARTLPQAHEICSFFDPYTGEDAGYLQVTRLSGAGPALVVVPEPGTRTPFEAFRPLDDASRRSQTFEGAFEWTVHSLGYAENEWKAARQWNEASSLTLQPGETKAYGLRFLVADQIRHIEQTLAANDRPVAVGIPGYIVPMDLDAQLFLEPGRRRVAGVASEPVGALDVTPAGTAKGGQLKYLVRGRHWGRARLTIQYDDSTTQTIHYDVTKPAQQAIADMGRFLTTRAWFTDAQDPFHRAPSVMNYDRAHDRIVLQDTRVWIAGLSDEGGAGAWLAALMKEFAQPDKTELDKLSEFVDHVIWGQLQYSEGPRMYGVKKSLFYYQPDLLPTFQYEPGNWTTWTSWNKDQAEAVNRAYDYPHVVAAYWTMYRLARNYPGLVTSHPWSWYLDHAFNTVKFMTGGFATPGERGGVGYVNVGLMDGDVFVLLLDDVKREGWTAQAAYLEGAMKQRADRWNSEAYPFGSEMAWDSTGQEEIFAWTDFFGYKDKAQVALDSILGYMPAIPHWGYNGNARRYWDFIYGGAPGGTIERQLHHYGSGINAIPVLAEYREHPDDDYLLRIGYAGAMGALSSIDQEGFPSAAFHSYPQNLRWDDDIGDYGPNFFGHAVSTGTYIVNHPDFGWVAFGGNLRTGVGPTGGSVTVEVLDSIRRRVYIAPLGLYVTLDRGTFERVALNPATGAVRVTLSPGSALTSSALVRIDQPATVAGVGKYTIVGAYAAERGGWVVPLTSAATTVELTSR